MTIEEQIADFQKQLSVLYLSVSDSYKRMSKAKDLHSRQIIQSGIDGALKRANEVSGKLELAKKEMFKQWDERRNEGPNKTAYD